jgi:hypothetical protein
MIRIEKRRMSGGRILTEVFDSDGEKIGTVMPVKNKENIKFAAHLDMGIYSHTTISFDGWGKTTEEAVANARDNGRAGLNEMQDRFDELSFDIDNDGITAGWGKWLTRKNG